MRKIVRRILLFLGVVAYLAVIVASGYLGYLLSFKPTPPPYRWDYETEEYGTFDVIRVATLRAGVSHESWNYTLSAASQRLKKLNMMLMNVGSVEAQRLPDTPVEMELACRAAGFEADVYVLAVDSQLGQTLIKKDGDECDTAGWAWLYSNYAVVLNAEDCIHSSETLLHELGHMGGMKHSDKKFDIMHPKNLMCEQPLTLNYMFYVRLAINRSWWH